MIRQSLTVNRNGVICHKTVTPNSIRSAIARDVCFAIEYKSNQGWYRVASYDDALTARQVFAERNRAFKWRLIAFNAVGAVRLPDNWRGA